jgi:hypothetical protein
MSKHGHVRPRADGIKARCGGPPICHACTAEAWQAGLMRHADDCQMRQQPPPGFPFAGFSCNCTPIYTPRSGDE